MQIDSTSRSRAGLAGFLDTHQDRILDAWSRRAREMPLANRLGESALRDHMPEILVTIADCIEGCDLALLEEGSSPIYHSLERLEAGFDLEQVAHEYRLLRLTVLELVGREAAPIDINEHIVLHEAIDAAIASSVAHGSAVRERTLRALDAISGAALNEGEQGSEVVRRLLVAVCETLPSLDAAALFLVEGEHLELQAAVGEERQHAVSGTVAFGEGVAGRAAATGEPIHVDAASADRAEDEGSPRGLGAVYALPLRVAGEVAAVLVVTSRSASTFANEDATLLRALAARAASVLAQARSSGEIQARDARLTRVVENAEQRALERAASERHRLFAVFDQAPVGIALFKGPSHVIEYANPFGARKIWGREPEDMIGLPIADALPEIAAQGLIKEVCDPVFQTGESMTFTDLPIEFDRARGGGLSEGYFTFVHVPVRDDDDDVEGFMAVAFDVTEQVLARRRAEQLAAKLEVAARTREDIVAIVSHDLRTPLNAIALTAAALSVSEDLDERTAKGLLRIRASTQRAAKLIHDLLDFTEARAQGIRVRPEPADFAEVVERVVEEVQLANPDRQIEVRAPEELPGRFDPGRLAQSITNLVENAVKHSPHDCAVVVTIGPDGDDAVITVHNQGEPIPEELRPHLFEPYRRGGEDGHKKGSVGLGLYIACKAVQAHGGDLSVRSTAEEGTTFTIRLPRSPAG